MLLQKSFLHLTQQVFEVDAAQEAIQLLSQTVLRKVINFLLVVRVLAREDLVQQDVQHAHICPLVYIDPAVRCLVIQGFL